MELTTYIGLSQQMAMRRQMDVIANNLANVNTTAFRGERSLFEEHLMRAGGPADRASFVLDYGTARDLRPGNLQMTGNPYDIAINGKGYLSVETESGVRYTRAGTLRVDAQGQLVTAAGQPVLDDRGRPLRLGDRSGPPSIAPDGAVTDGAGTAAGKLGLVTFANEQALQGAGDGLYATDQEPRPAADSTVAQGMLEGSNIQPIVEMTNMIELVRSYQATQRMIETEHDLQRKAIERLARTS